MDDAPVNVPTFSQLLESMQSWPLQTQIGVFLFAAIWIIGGNIVFLRSLKRRGISWRKSLIPAISHFTGLNKSEWLALGVLAVVSLAFGAWGISGQAL